MSSSKVWPLDKWYKKVIYVVGWLYVVYVAIVIFAYIVAALVSDINGTI